MVDLLDLIHRHRQEPPAREGSEQSEESHAGRRDSSLSSLTSQPGPLTEADRCAAWLVRFVRGRYPRLVDVRAAAGTAGYSPAAVEAGLRSPDLVVYRAFPRWKALDVERVRTVDDWPDDPPLSSR